MFDELFAYFSQDPLRLVIAIALVIICIVWFAVRGRVSSFLNRFSAFQKLSGELRNILSIALMMLAFLLFAFVCLSVFAR